PWRKSTASRCPSKPIELVDGSGPHEATHHFHADASLSAALLQEGLRPTRRLQDRRPLERRHHFRTENLCAELCGLPTGVVPPEPAEAGGLPDRPRRDTGGSGHLPDRARYARQKAGTAG